MRFSTKILMLTLATTLGLSGIVVLVVRNEITTQETLRAQSRIAESDRVFLERLKARQEKISSNVTNLVLEDQNYRSYLEPLSSDANSTEREDARGQYKVLFDQVLQTKLDGPALHALVDKRGRTLVAFAKDDPALENLLEGQHVSWHISEALDSRDGILQYLLLNGRLYLAFGLPLIQTSGENPNFAYFCGFHVTDDWLQRLLETGQDEAPVATWFIVDGQIVARGTNRPTSLGARGERVAIELADSPHRARLGQRASATLKVDGETLTAQYTSYQPAPNVRMVLAQASSLDEALQPLRHLLKQIGFVTIFVIALAIIAARWISRRLARPIELLVEGTNRIAKGDFTHGIELRRRDEIGELASSFNEMAIGLAQRDLIKDTLGQFVDPRIADALLTNPASLRGQRAVQSVLFSDLEKFTSISEKLPPEDLVKMLNRFLGASADVVKELNGYLDKFTGDGVIAFWGPPVEMNHSIAACRAALRMIEFTKQFQDPPLRVRVGIATGEVLVGIVGSESSKKNYTAMGDVVNLASRLEGANKVYGTNILVDARTAREVAGVMSTRRIDVVRVVGRAEPVELHEVLGEAATANHSGGIQCFEDALKLYTAGQWSRAAQSFAVLDGDPAARAMTLRCQRLAAAAADDRPPASWDGVWTLDVK